MDRRKLTPHLLEINDTAFAQIDLTVRQLLKSYPAPDRSADHLAYVAHMNSLTAMAEETVFHDLIYTCITLTEAHTASVRS